MNVTAEQIRVAQLELDGLQRRYLIERGWKESCDYPDSCWRWEKAVPRKDRTVTLTLSANRAFKVEHDFLDVQ